MFLAGEHNTMLNHLKEWNLSQHSNNLMVGITCEQNILFLLAKTVHFNGTTTKYTVSNKRLTLKKKKKKKKKKKNP
jgi:hypothetical protein